MSDVPAFGLLMDTFIVASGPLLSFTLVFLIVFYGKPGEGYGRARVRVRVRARVMLRVRGGAQSIARPLVRSPSISLSHSPLIHSLP